MNNNFFKRPLSQRITDRSKQGRRLKATVVDYFSGRATVRISMTGALMRNLNVVGGPVETGDIVDVNTSLDPPLVVALGKEWMDEASVRSLFDEMTEGRVEQGLLLTIALFSGGGLRELYSPDASGLEEALGEANEGDVIYLPDIDIQNDITIPDGVAIVGLSSRESIIRGIVTMNPSDGYTCTLENVCVLYGASTENEISALIVEGDGKAIIRNCEVHGYNCSSGRANGVEVAENTVTAVFQNCTVIADSNSGTAYAFKGIASGNCKILDGFVYGKTGEYDGDGLYVYGNTEAFSEIERGCPATSPSNAKTVISMHISGNAMHDLADLYAVLDGEITADTPVNFYTSGSHGYTGGVVRRDNYIYYWKNVYAEDYYLAEYDIDTDTEIVVKVCDSYATNQNSGFTYTWVGERKLCTMNPGANYSDPNLGNVYEVDFSAQTSTKIHEFNWNNQRDAPGSVASGPSIVCSQMVGVLTPLDEIVVVILSTYAESDASYHQYWGTHIAVKNFTAGTGWSETFKLYDTLMDNNYDTETPYYYAVPQVVRNERVVFSLSSGCQSSPNTDMQYVFPVVNLYTETFDYVRYEKSSPLIDTMITYNGTVNNNDGVAFFSGYYLTGNNECSVVMIDPYAMTVDENYWTNTGGAATPAVGFFSLTKGYMYAYDDSKSMYLLTRSGKTLLWSNWTPPSDWFNQHGSRIDVNNRYYYFDAGYIRGMLVTDKDDVVSFDTGLSVSGSWMNCFLFGDDMFLLRDRSSNACQLYYVKDIGGS